MTGQGSNALPTQPGPTYEFDQCIGWKSVPVPKRAAWAGSLWTFVPVTIKMTKYRHFDCHRHRSSHSSDCKQGRSARI